MRAPTSFVGLRVLAWRSRPLLLIAGVVALALLVARQISPPPPATEPVVVAARTVPSGALLVEADLRVARVPPRLAPDEAVADPGSLTGRTALVELSRGVPVVPSMLDEGRFGWTAPPGTVTVPVRLADAAVAGLLRPGDRIDLVAPGSDAGGAATAVVVARGALVLEVITESEAGSALDVLEPDPDTVTVVAVTPAEGHHLAAAGRGSLGAVLVEGS